MEDMGSGQEEAKNTRTTEAREYRRGNWTLPETMVLIEAKKRMHDDRAPAENLARWKWVEDYCWRGGCRRSQNQCNDRWDNLMRDYKKVRAYEHGPGRSGSGGEGGGHYPSYWAMGRVERKERGLPTNLLREIYEAMGEVVERKMSCGGGGVFVGASSSLVDVPMQASPLAQVLPRALEHETHGAMHCSHDSPERKRRRPSGDHRQPGSRTPSVPRFDQEEHHHGDDDNDGGEDSEDDLSSAIGRCAAILSEAMESSEAAEERRHREVMSMEQRRSRARQARREASEQCMAELAAAMNRLASSMLALHQATAAAKRRPTTDKRGPTGPK